MESNKDNNQNASNMISNAPQNEEEKKEEKKHCSCFKHIKNFKTTQYECNKKRPRRSYQR